MSLLVGIVFVFLFAFGVSGAVTVYDDAPTRTNIIASTNDVVVFDDGFCCPTGYVFNDVTEVANGWNGGAQIGEAMNFPLLTEKQAKTMAISIL